MAGLVIVIFFAIGIVARFEWRDYPYIFDGVHNYFAEVVWFNNIPAFGVITHKHKNSDVNGLSEGDSALFYTDSRKEWLIIGNTFDNPEMFGGSDQYDCCE